MSVNGKAQGLSALDHFPTVNHDTDKSAADEQIARTSSNEAHEYEAKDFDTACKLAVQKSSEPISIDEAKTEFKEKLDKLCKLTENVDIKQVEFQKLVGKIEVLGELIIKHK